MENTPQDIPQKRPRGRPKTQPLTKQEYEKQYRQNIIQNNPQIKNNVIISKQRYSNSLKKSLALIKLMHKNNDIQEKYKPFLNEIII
jgi:hypothetical protein